MPYRSVTVFVGQDIPASCPGAENAWTRLYVDPGDAVTGANIGAAEVSDATVLAVSNVALTTLPIDDQENGVVIPAGEAVTFDVTISKPAGYSLPKDEYVIIPYTTDNGDSRRAKQTFALRDAIEAGGGILPSMFLSGGIAMGWESIAWGWNGIAMGFGG